MVFLKYVCFKMQLNCKTGLFNKIQGTSVANYYDY